LDEGVEEGGSVFGCGGEVGSNRGELSGAGKGSGASGYFLAEFDHPDFPLCGVVVKGDPEIGREPQVVVVAVEDPAGQGVVAGHGLGGTCLVLTRFRE
jgi:hypothetical protein